MRNRSSASQRSSVTSTPCLSRDNSRTSGTGSDALARGGGGGGGNQNNMLVQTSFDSGYGIHSIVTKDGKRETVINDVYSGMGAGGKKAGVAILQ